MINAKNICAILEIILFYGIIFVGLNKSHLFSRLREMKKKEKAITFALFAIMIFFVLVRVSGVTKLQLENSNYILDNVIGFFSEMFQNNITILLLMEYFALVIPGILIYAMGMKIFAEKCCKVVVPLFYLSLIPMVNPYLYDCDKWNFSSSVFLLNVMVLFYLVMICVKFGFTIKKMVFMVLFLLMAIGCFYYSATSNMELFFFVVESIGVGMAFCGIEKVLSYLRVTIRRAGTLVLLLLVVIIQMVVW